MRVRLSVATALAAVLLSSAVATADPSPPTSYTYDANGNLTSKTESGVVWTYVYDARNQLREVRRDGIVLGSYQYDAQGHRVRKTSPEGTVRYVWDEDRILLETDDFGNRIAKYEYAGDRLLSVQREGEGRSFYLFDALGTPVSLVAADGSVRERTKLDAWGFVRERNGSSKNPFAFTGHTLDDETGLYYAKARFYDPELGRFLSEDPVRGSIVEPRSLHPYLYAYANPTVYVDPDGRCVGSLQKTSFCQAIAKGIAFVLAGDPVARAEREIKIREKVVQGRREFRATTEREPQPNEVVWSEPGREYTSSFREMDTSGRTEPDHAEWMAIGAAVSTRVAVGAARAAGATTAEQVAAASTQLGDEAVGELTGLSPGDVADLARLVNRGFSPSLPSHYSPDPGVYITVEGNGIGATRVRASESPERPHPPDSANRTWARSGLLNDQPVSWTATRPRGTGQTYEVLQRVDIDWNRVRTSGDKRFIGKTNAEAARAGLPPQLDDRSFATLHHVGQDARGPLVEASTRYHGVGRFGQQPLHSQYGANQPHPTRPIDRQQFPVDSREYWQWRVKEEHP